MKKDPDKKYVRVKIYAKKQGDNELNLVHERDVSIWESDCVDLFAPSIFADDVRLKITLTDKTN